jgi:hypothetical protein
LSRAGGTTSSPGWPRSRRRTSPRRPRRDAARTGSQMNSTRPVAARRARRDRGRRTCRGDTGSLPTQVCGRVPGSCGCTSLAP